MAMKINELMIGDWVNYSILNLNAKVFSILGNHTIGIQFVDKNNKIEAIHGLLEETIIPIPLTEEILVKNGFEKTKGGEYERTRYVMFSDKSWVALYTREAGGYSAFLNKIVVIHYVHQLQHLLRLCGVEKELVID